MSPAMRCRVRRKNEEKIRTLNQVNEEEKPKT